MRIISEIIFALIGTSSLFVQELSVQGIILDNEGVSLINANVHEQNMNNTVDSKLCRDVVNYGHSIIVIHGLTAI